jgi:hypothetical protein
VSRVLIRSLRNLIIPNTFLIRFPSTEEYTEILPDAEETCPQAAEAFLVVSGVGKPLKKRSHRIGR